MCSNMSGRYFSAKGGAVRWAFCRGKLGHSQGASLDLASISEGPDTPGPGDSSDFLHVSPRNVPIRGSAGAESQPSVV